MSDLGGGHSALYGNERVLRLLSQHKTDMSTKVIFSTRVQQHALLVSSSKCSEIVGGGEFGSTTALELARNAYKGNEHLITVLDRSATPPATDAASFDFNKIVRQEYSDPLYARLAHDAMDLWRTPEWKDYYHECGVVVSVSRSAQQSEYITRALAVNALPGMQTPGLEAKILPTRDDVQAVYPKDAPLGDFASQNVYINYAGGWANARGATEAAVAKARALGVQFRAGTAKELLIDERRNVLGVVTQENGDRVMADFTVLCMGAWTPLLVPELKNDCLPTGQVVGAIQLTSEEHKRYKDVPVTRMIDNGFYIFPPTADGIVKFAIHQKGYLNPQDGYPSLPRTTLTRGFENQRVPETARQHLMIGLKRVYPELAKKEWLTSRICWYSDRPSGDWIMDYHPSYEGLFVAAGCCGHAFKFLPILGRLIVQSVNRELPKELADIWAFQHRVEGRRDESRNFSQYYRLNAAATDSRL